MRNKLVEALASFTASSQKITPHIIALQFSIVNAFLVEIPGFMPKKWVLIDTGLTNSADYILTTSEKHFGKDNRPQAILLTHGHFDHVGSVKKLSQLWNVPVYIHPLEIPYVTGKKDYPSGDPTVDEGLVAKMSPSLPHTSIDISSHAVALPTGGVLPFMPDWKWIHTPGHTEGHVSLFCEKDAVLIAGDAFTTLKQESLLSVLTQSEKIGGPPKYFTFDWKVAEDSVNLLRDLNPSLAIPSHGQPMDGEDLRRHLEFLVQNFDKIAIPEQGCFVDYS